MQTNLTCNCGYIHRDIKLDEKRQCRCGATVWVKQRAAGHLQPIVELPDDINLTEYLRTAKLMRFRLEFKR